MTTTAIELTGRDPAGRPARWTLASAQPLAEGGSPLRTDRCALPDGHIMLRRTLPDERFDETAELLLDNEIRALTRLADRYPADRYPTGLPHLVGYDFDGAQPFLLLTDDPGTPASGSALHLVIEQRTALVTGLLLALADLAAVDLVHGAIGLSSIRWDGATVRLADFGHAVVTGERRRTRTGSPWAAPDTDTAPASPGDDIYSAGLVIHQVFTGRPTPAVPPDLAAAPHFLHDLLSGVFAPSPTDRPSAVDLLRRLEVRVPRPQPIDLDAELRPGREGFDAVRRDKPLAARADAPPTPPPTPPPTDKPAAAPTASSPTSAGPRRPPVPRRPIGAGVSQARARALLGLLVLVIAGVLVLLWVSGVL